MSRILNIVLILLVLAAVALKRGKWLSTDTSSAKQSELVAAVTSVPMEYVKEVFTDATGLREIDTSWVEVYNSQQQKLGEVMLTSPYSDKVIGYSGKTPLLIALDTTRHIIQVQLLNNVESPSYLNHAIKEGLFEVWNGLSLTDALEKQVDNVTGATYTSQAVIKSLQVRLSVAVDAEHQRAAFPWYAMLKHLCVLVVLGLALYSFFRPTKAKKFRIVLLLLSIAILGFWQGSMLSLVQFFTWLTNGIPLATQWVMLLILLFAVSLPMFTGKAFYCTYLCPFGAAQELVGKLKKKRYR